MSHLKKTLGVCRALTLVGNLSRRARKLWWHRPSSCCAFGLVRKWAWSVSLRPSYVPPKGRIWRFFAYQQDNLSKFWARKLKFSMNLPLVTHLDEFENRPVLSASVQVRALRGIKFGILFQKIWSVHQSFIFHENWFCKSKISVRKVV